MFSLTPDKTEQFQFSPHLRISRSTKTIFWGLFASLLPIWIGSFIFFGWDAFRVLFLVMGSGSAFAWLIHRIIERKIHWEYVLFFTALFGLLLPATLSSKVAVFGSFAAVVFGYGLFGGLGQNIFHPALVGYLSLTGLFPFQMQTEPLGCRSLLAIAIGGAAALAQKCIRLETVCFYLAGAGISAYLFGMYHDLFNPKLLLCAVFVITDSVTAPVTRGARVFFAAAAGILTAPLRFWTGDLQAITSAVLLMSAATPLMEQMSRRVRKKS